MARRGGVLYDRSTYAGCSRVEASAMVHLERRVDVHDKLHQDLECIPIAGAERKLITDEENLEQKDDFGYLAGMIDCAELT